MKVGSIYSEAMTTDAQDDLPDVSLVTGKARVRPQRQTDGDKALLVYDAGKKL